MSRFYSRVVPQQKLTANSARRALPGTQESAPVFDGRLSGLAAGNEQNRIGLFVTLMGIYLFMHVLPFAEVTAVHFNLHIPIVAAMCALVTLISPFTFRLQRFFGTSVALPWTLLAVPLFLASIFGIYPRLSTSFISGYLCRFHVMPLLICASVVTTKQVRHIMLWIIGAHAVALLICWKYGQSADGRLFVPGYDYQNPNDLALCIIFGACFALLLLFLRSFMAKVVALGMLAISILDVARTASRAGLVCLVIMAIALFVTSAASVRVFLVAVTPLAVVLLAWMVPHGTWMRFSMITLHPQEEYFNTNDEELRRAVESQMARMNLQERAIEIAIRHPLLGVGPEMFADAVDVLVRERTGRKSGWQNPHNVYLQIAAETGIPALILYVTCMVLCVKLNYQSLKACRGAVEHRMAYAQSVCLLAATLTFAIGILFSNFAFSSHMPILVGLTAANALAVKEELRKRKDEVVAIPRPYGSQPALVG
jgi:O-antigen ligase